MPANYYDPNIPQGASRISEPPPDVYGDMGPGTASGGGGSDPLAYTNGSWYTPWEGRFNSGGYGGGASAPKYTKFNYKDFKFNAPKVGQFGEVYNNPAAMGETYVNPEAMAAYTDPAAFGETYADPAAFRFADFAGPRDFQAPTAEDMRADPGYQARMDAVKNAQVAGAAHGGVLRSGGFQKGLAKAVGDQASQEYGSVYNRRASEHDRARAEAVSNYGLNQGNTFQAFGANTANRLAGYQTRRQGYEADVANRLAGYQTRRQAYEGDVANQRAGYQLRRGAYEGDIQNQLAGYQTRQGAWQANANTALAEGQLGYNVAQGTWDRNYGKARTGYEDEKQHRAQVAAASSANANRRYQNDLADYTRARDEFWTNQDRQYGIYDREANRGLLAAGQLAQQIRAGYGDMGDYEMGGANAEAAGTSAGGRAWGDFAGNMGNLGAEYATMAASRRYPGKPDYTARDDNYPG